MKVMRLIKNNWLILAIILAGAYLRFANISSLTTFSGDQGFDFPIIKKIVTEGDFTLLGPKIGPYNTLGHLYLGPAYYYILAPALLIWGLDPLGPAILTAALSVLTIFLIYEFSKRYLNGAIGILAAALYATNPFLISQSRAPSNPHLMPFFSMTFFLALLESTKEAKAKEASIIWPAILGISFGILFQLHYLAVALLPLFVLFLIRRKIKNLIVALLFIFLTVLPQIIFELTHQYFVTNLFIRQMELGNNVSSSARVLDKIASSYAQLSTIFFSSGVLTGFLSAAAVISILIYIVKDKTHRFTLSVLMFSALLAVILVSLYSGSVESHYFASIYPAVVILAASSLYFVFNLTKNLIIRTVIILFVAQLAVSGISGINLKQDHGYTMPDGWNLVGQRKAARIIAQDAKNSNNFNIASKLDGDTRAMPVRYLADVYGVKANKVESYPDANVIYLLSRDDSEAVKGYTVWEISSFRPFEIGNKWEIQNGIYLYKLTKPSQTN